MTAVQTSSTVNTQFRVQLQPGCWLARPGRTLREDHAALYPTEQGARVALGMARRYRTWTNPVIEPVEVTP